jgi:hypothetical protein
MINQGESTNDKPKTESRPLTPEERAAGRARVAELLGQLLFKRWFQDRSEREEDRKSDTR